MKWIRLRSPYEDMELCGSIKGDYQFIISEENGEFRASWKNNKFDLKPFGKQPANYIGGVFNSFEAAEEACEATYKQLRAKQ